MRGRSSLLIGNVYAWSNWGPEFGSLAEQPVKARGGFDDRPRLVSRQASGASSLFWWRLN